MLFKQINILDENLKLQEDCYVAVRNGKIVSISAQRPAENGNGNTMAEANCL